MLEVNNFNAIRISLASPDQIREWSKGEVTKPETINYGRSSPRRTACSTSASSADQGLGVLLRQVQADPLQGHHRRQVRRRGHAPEGPPSAWANPAGEPCQPHLVLQGTPELARDPARHQPARSERILHFALFIVTYVDEMRAQACPAWSRRRPRVAVAGVGERLTELEDELRADLNRRKDELTARKATSEPDFEAQRAARTEEIVAAAKEVEAWLAELKLGTAEESTAFALTAEVIVAAGDKGGKEATARLRKTVADHSEQVNAELQQREAGTALRGRPEGRGPGTHGRGAPP